MKEIYPSEPVTELSRRQIRQAQRLGQRGLRLASKGVDYARSHTIPSPFIRCTAPEVVARANQMLMGSDVQVDVFGFGDPNGGEEQMRIRSNNEDSLLVSHLTTGGL